MYDPTIFENLKVAIENQVYDLDNIDEEIDVSNRTDSLDMATMSRQFTLQFSLKDQPEINGEIALEASLRDLAAEILEVSGEEPGCMIKLRFYLVVEDVAIECKKIQEIVQNIWEQEPLPTQTLSFVYNEEKKVYKDIIEVTFNHKINESHMDDIPELVEHVLQTLDELDEIK